jgi:hypothetical protein
MELHSRIYYLFLWYLQGRMRAEGAELGAQRQVGRPAAVRRRHLTLALIRGQRRRWEHQRVRYVLWFLQIRTGRQKQRPRSPQLGVDCRFVDGPFAPFEAGGVRLPLLDSLGGRGRGREL